MNNPGTPFAQNPDFPTSIPVQVAPPVPEDDIKSAGPPKQTGGQTPQSQSAKPQESPSQPPPVTAGTPGQHYSGEHAPNQHPDGERAPIPVSHVPISDPQSIQDVLDACEGLWEEARFPRIDASWPRLRARLRQYERELPEGSDQLRLVRWYLYHVRSVAAVASPRAKTLVDNDLFGRLGRASAALMSHGIDSSVITEAVLEVVVLATQRDKLLEACQELIERLDTISGDICFRNQSSAIEAVEKMVSAIVDVADPKKGDD
jgi:hypothetical protein